MVISTSTTTMQHKLVRHWPLSNEKDKSGEISLEFVKTQKFARDKNGFASKGFNFNKYILNYNFKFLFYLNINNLATRIKNGYMKLPGQKYFDEYFTIMFWLKVLDGNWDIAFKFKNKDHKNKYEIIGLTSKTGSLSFNMTVNEEEKSCFNYKLKKWYHVALVHDNKKSQLIINSKKKCVLNESLNTDWKMVESFWNATNLIVDEIKIFNHTLSINSITNENGIESDK